MLRTSQPVLARQPVQTARLGARKAFTLLEVMLAAAIGVLLVIALYAAISTQVMQAQAGREVIEEAMLARSILNRMGSDVLATANLCDPARYRNKNQSSDAGSSSASGSTGTSTTPSTGSTTTGTTGTSTSATTGTGATSGSTGSTSSAATSTTGDATTAGAGSGPVTIPLGIRGDSTSLSLFVSKFPSEVFPSRSGDQGQFASDLRRITYWVGGGDNAGLARQEIKVITAQDVTDGVSPMGGSDEANLVIAPEVRSIQFQYFDGSSWQDSWDSTAMGADGITPLGSPRAVAIRIGLVQTGKKAGVTDNLKYVRHVVAIATANGTTQQNNTGGTSP